MRHLFNLAVWLSPGLLAAGCSETVAADEPAPAATCQATTSYLALGDSYTIGQSVAESERWPVFLASHLAEQGIDVGTPEIIARTGWTTNELAAAVADADVAGRYGLVTLLVGVNDQYRGGTPEAYREDFSSLLQTAITLAGGNPQQVIVLSIPDWGQSPYGLSFDSAAIGADIDAFNAVNREVTEAASARYVEITGTTRTTDPAAFARDGLHYSATTHDAWAAASLSEASDAICQ